MTILFESNVANTQRLMFDIGDGSGPTTILISIHIASKKHIICLSRNKKNKKRYFNAALVVS
jgi:precorrin-6B methylase 2